MNALDEQKPSRRLWVFAAVTALVLHVGGAALAIAHLQTEEADDALGATAIEVGIELASVRREVTVDFGQRQWYGDDRAVGGGLLVLHAELDPDLEMQRLIGN